MNLVSQLLQTNLVYLTTLFGFIALGYKQVKSHEITNAVISFSAKCHLFELIDILHSQYRLSACNYFIFVIRVESAFKKKVLINTKVKRFSLSCVQSGSLIFEIYI